MAEERPEDQAEIEPSQETGSTPESGPKTGGGPLNILLPVDLRVWNEARRLAGNRNARVEELAAICAQDPAMVLELLRVANAMYFSGGRPPITTTKFAIQRLGSDVVVETLEKLRERPNITSEDVEHWFHIHRSRCKRTSLVSKILSEVNNRTLSDDCQTAGLMMFVGEMVAVAYLQERYVALAEEFSRGSLNYRLNQDFKFDVERINVGFLRRNGIPEDILFALDHEAFTKKPDRAIMRPLCSAAGEMVDAFDLNRWEKIAPGRKIPSSSPIRLLQFSDSQYLKVYERVSEFLFAIRMDEERRKREETNAEAAPIAVPKTDEPTRKTEDEQLENDIQNLLSNIGAKAAPISITPEVIAPAKVVEEEFQADEAVATTSINTIIESLDNDIDAFQLKPKKSSEKATPRTEVTRIVAPPMMRTKGANQFVENLVGEFDSYKSSEDLLSGILAKLVDHGPFKRTALIVVSKDRNSALVVASRGPIGNGQKLSLADPLSPLRSCFSKVQSFGNQSNPSSPFGSKAFALAPIDADHDTPVALYADCGDEGSITFEARRVFRNVVELLNQKLPQVPGGIPVELKDL